jgi:hypothetical protein
MSLRSVVDRSTGERMQHRYRLRFERPWLTKAEPQCRAQRALPVSPPGRFAQTAAQDAALALGDFRQSPYRSGDGPPRFARNH